MKQSLHLFLSILPLLLAGIGSTVAQTTEAKPHLIQVTGTSTITLSPDELTMSITITQQNPDSKKAVEAYRSSREGVLSALKTFKVGDTNITEYGLSFSKEAERNYETGKIIKEYYLATTTISIVMRKFDSYPDLVIALTGLPGVELGYVNYRSSKEIETRKKARIQAMEEAKKKAEAMAAVCGARIGKPLLIRENIPNAYTPYQSRSGMASNTLNYGGYDGDAAEESRSDLVVSNDAIQVTVSVYVEFELE